MAVYPIFLINFLIKNDRMPLNDTRLPLFNRKHKQKASFLFGGMTYRKLCELALSPLPLGEGWGEGFGMSHYS